jgi:transposase-like protein
MPSPSPEREAHWRRVMARHRESGASIAEFCRQESISEASFYAWRRKLQQRSRRRASHTEAARRDASSPSALIPSILPVRIEPAVDASAALRIHWPGGIWLEMTRPVSQQEVAALLGALAETLSPSDEAQAC